jgi:phage-related protein
LPATNVIFYCDRNGRAPVLDWFTELRRRDKKGWANCVARVEQLKQMGHELRRPSADYLRDGIYELRAKKGHVQYRILYFFHGQNAAVLGHAIIKDQAAVADIDIERALNRKRDFELDPKQRTYVG